MRNRTVFRVIMLAAIVAIFAGLFASLNPDGLEKVMGILKFGAKAKSTSGVFIDYQLPMFPYPALSKALAGIFGIIVIFFIFKSIARVRYLGELLKKLLNIR